MLGCHRQANQSAAILRHEVNNLRCDLFGCDSQIALVFAAFIVNDDYHLPCMYGRNSILNASEWTGDAVGFANNLKPLSHISHRQLSIGSSRRSRFAASTKQREKAQSPAKRRLLPCVRIRSKFATGLLRAASRRYTEANGCHSLHQSPTLAHTRPIG